MYVNISKLWRYSSLHMMALLCDIDYRDLHNIKKKSPLPLITSALRKFFGGTVQLILCKIFSSPGFQFDRLYFMSII